jgi:hypothetical protein
MAGNRWPLFIPWHIRGVIRIYKLTVDTMISICYACKLVIGSCLCESCGLWSEIGCDDEGGAGGMNIPLTTMRYYNYTNFCRFLTVLEYSPIDMKFPPTIPQRILYCTL